MCHLLRIRLGSPMATNFEDEIRVPAGCDSLLLCRCTASLNLNTTYSLVADCSAAAEA